MKQSLRDFLREHCSNLSESDLDKLERGERPDDPNVLHKGAGTELAKLIEYQEALSEFHKRETDECMREINKLFGAIQDGLNSILRHDRERGALARGVADLHNGAEINGLAGIETALAALSKSKGPRP
jgi:hypothetical protein